MNLEMCLPVLVMRTVGVQATQTQSSPTTWLCVWEDFPHNYYDNIADSCFSVAEFQDLKALSTPMSGT